MASEVLSTLPKSTIALVIPDTVPVNVGEARGAFKPIAVAVVVAKFASSPRASANSLRVFKVAGAESIIAATAASAYAVVAICVLLFPGEAVGAIGVPVNEGLARGAFKSKAVCCAVDTGFAVSAVLSTEPKPTIDFEIPDTVPVNVGEASGAFSAKSALSLTQAVPFHLSKSPLAAEVGVKERTARAIPYT